MFITKYLIDCCLNTGAYVKFEKSLYEVTERVNYSVEVCAIITSPDIVCPVDFIFELILSVGLSKSIANYSITMMKVSYFSS